MTKTLLSLTLISALLSLGFQPVYAAARPKDDMPSVEKVRRAIDKLGVGEKARINLKLRDGRKLEGYVHQTGDDDFVIVEKKTGQRMTIAYEDVQKVKGRDSSTGKQIAIGVAAGVGAYFLAMGILVAVTAIQLGH
ncbi:MAG TPA: hypothetical protein VF666_16075 [Pyrinomonadaceae bacterium]